MNLDFTKLDIVNNLIAPLVVLAIAGFFGLIFKKISWAKWVAIGCVIVAIVVFVIRPWPHARPESWQWIDASAPDKYPKYLQVIQNDIFGTMDPIAGEARTELEALRKANHYLKPGVDRESAYSPEYEPGKAPHKLRVRAGLDVRFIAYILAQKENEWRTVKKTSQPTDYSDLNTDETDSPRLRIVVMVFPISETGYKSLMANVRAKRLDLLDFSQ